MSQKSRLDNSSQGGLAHSGGEEAPSDTQSYTNKHKLPHSHDSTGVGGHTAESSWPAGERNAACLHGRPRYILVLASWTCVWSYPNTCMHIHMNPHTQPQCSSQACPSLLPPLVTVKRRQPSSGKPRVNLYCIYWSACCILLFICPCGWNSVCAPCKDVKLSLSRRYFWKHLLSQLKPVSAEIIRVNWGVLQWPDDAINQVMQPLTICFYL